MTITPEVLIFIALYSITYAVFLFILGFASLAYWFYLRHA